MNDISKKSLNVTDDLCQGDRKTEDLIRISA